MDNLDPPSSESSMLMISLRDLNLKIRLRPLILRGTTIEAQLREPFYNGSGTGGGLTLTGWYSGRTLGRDIWMTKSLAVSVEGIREPVQC